MYELWDIDFDKLHPPNYRTEKSEGGYAAKVTYVPYILPYRNLPALHDGEYLLVLADFAFP